MNQTIFKLWVFIWHCSTQVCDVSEWITQTFMYKMLLLLHFDFVRFEMLFAGYFFRGTDAPLKSWKMLIFKVVQWVSCFDFTHLKRGCCWCRVWGRGGGVSDLQWWESGLFSPWQNIFLCNWQEVGKGGGVGCLAMHETTCLTLSVLDLLVSSTVKMVEAEAPLLFAGYSVSPLTLPRSPHCFFISSHWLAIFTPGQCWAVSCRSASQTRDSTDLQCNIVHGWPPIHCTSTLFTYWDGVDLNIMFYWGFGYNISLIIPPFPSLISRWRWLTLEPIEN